MQKDTAAPPDMPPTSSGNTQPQPLAGVRLLREPFLNKDTAFTQQERQQLGLQGLLPPRVESMADQAARALEIVRRKSSPLEKHVCLSHLRHRNETLFYRVVVDHLEEMLPLVYTPTVGQACIEWSHLYSEPGGLYVTWEDRGKVASVLRNWPERGVRILVVTDGSRILGLGDLGANGMGIPIGKLALYSACAGIHPSACLPVTLDVGTDNAALRADPLYLGRRTPRIEAQAYDELIEEFVTATQEVFPGCVVQFEDFSNLNAFRLLARYADRLCCFNDDIQGTGAMGLAGITAALRITDSRIVDQRVLFAGAGEACLGIGRLVVSSMTRAGLAVDEAKARCWFWDRCGLVTTKRADLPPHKRAFAQDREPMSDLLSAIEAFRPTILIGASGQGGLFTQPVLAAMARFNDRPIVFALSNPTGKAECTAEQACTWTEGRAIFASGSPFPPVEFAGKTLVPGQANNCHIFPGLGLGLLVSGASRVTDDMFFAAASALAGEVRASDLELGCVFPPAARMRDVAGKVATSVAEVVYERGLGRGQAPEDLAAKIEAARYEPSYG